MRRIERRGHFPVFYAEVQDFERAITNRATRQPSARPVPGFLAQARLAWRAHVLRELTPQEREFLPVVRRTGATKGYGLWTGIALGLVEKGLLGQSREGKFLLTREGAAVAQQLVR